jgi:hypothetical protein
MRHPVDPLGYRKDATMKITDRAREKLAEALKDHPGKTLRIVFQGFG